MNGITYEAVVDSNNTVSISANDVITLESFFLSQGEITGQGMIETTHQSVLSNTGTISGITLSGGTLNWFRGTLADGVVLTDTSQTVISSNTLPGQQAIVQGVVTNNGSIDWQQGVLNFNTGGSELVNNGDFTITGGIRAEGASSSSITNNGTLSTVGNVNVDIEIPFHNEGIVDVTQGGDLSLERGGAANGMHLIADAQDCFCPATIPTMLFPMV